MPFMIANWRLILVGALILGLGFYAGLMRIERDAVRAEYAEFKQKIASAAAAAAEAALKKTIEDEKRKEKIDADHAKALADLNDTVTKLRANRPAGGVLPPSTIGPGSPDIACFDRPVLERAYGALVIGLRGLSDEGSKAVVDLNAAKEWAKVR